ncbi:colanic acid biosynthesis glycosyltransferase WcaL [Moorella sp. E308F]|uniref:glycosyltransferase n=1 Tax=Moorella sp. E308F TaxID=2572682 RepID=UPI0010FFB76F|nr:glycosyltransferase [Moorella sp. E308F]GEA16570.1 colanic acid biosynthesis glycosyltransferase WcaL [Moorella sp. E308F]
MKIAYITAHAPFGRGETFVLEEMLAMAELGVELVIVPRNPPKEVFHDLARQLLDRAIWLPLFNWRIFLSFLKTVALNPRLWRILGRILRHSRTLKILVKNLAVVPKAVFIAGLLRQARVEHIHAHWGSTTATMAWIASELTGIPWSVTLHRWDIAENNLLRFKVERAAFVRCISEDGRREVLCIVGETYQDKVKVLHMGVRLPDTLLPQFHPSRPDFVFACPANLVPVKGHRFLIEACALLLETGIRDFRCLFIGDGPLEAEIRQQIAQLGLEEVVSLVGRLPHGELLRMYERGEVDAVVLPSIVTGDDEREGIPVALMEAMAYGIPVVSTNTGGIPELLSDGAGIIVRDKDARQLAGAVERLIKDEKLAREIGEKGRRKVDEEFNLHKNVKLLLQKIKSK